MIKYWLTLLLTIARIMSILIFPDGAATCPKNRPWMFGRAQGYNGRGRIDPGPYNVYGPGRLAHTECLRLDLQGMYECMRTKGYILYKNMTFDTL